MKLDEIIESCAKEFKLDFCLIKAIVMSESSEKNESARFEPAYKYLFEVKSYAKGHGITELTEETLQKFSWGYMQVMGAVARERGFTGFLTRLTQPYDGIFWGCKQLKYFSDRYKTVDDVIAAYNAGSPRKAANGTYVNQVYVNRVKSFMAQVKRDRK